MSDQSTDGIDREGVGMLYAGGAGLMVGGSVGMYVEAFSAHLLGAVVVALGLGYESYQRYTATDNERGNNE